MILLGVPALPLPTGGVTHVFEVITVLLAAQLVVGRDDDLAAASSGAVWSSPGTGSRSSSPG